MTMLIRQCSFYYQSKHRCHLYLSVAYSELVRDRCDPLIRDGRNSSSIHARARGILVNLVFMFVNGNDLEAKRHSLVVYFC